MNDKSTVSFYGNVFDKIGIPCEMQKILSAIQSGKWKPQIEKLRAIQDEKAQKTFKNTLPCYTPSGLFSERNAESLKSHSSVLVLDFDKKDNPSLGEKFNEIRNNLFTDRYTYFLFTSCRGNGIALGVRIDGVKHLENFLFLERYYRENFGLVVDKGCKDVCRLRFVSYDPELFINEKAEIVIPDVQAVKDTAPTARPDQASNGNMSDRERMDDIIASGVTLVDDHQHGARVKIAHGLSTAFGESLGRMYTHSILSKCADYDRETTDKYFTGIHRNNKGTVNFASIVFLAKQAGYTPTRKGKMNIAKSVFKEITADDVNTVKQDKQDDKKQKYANTDLGNKDSELIKKYGNPYYYNKHGKAESINEGYWAGYHCSRHEEFYEPYEKKFFHYDPTAGLYSPVTPDRIKQEISEYILEQSKDVPGLEKCRSDKNLNAVANQLRGIVEKTNPFDKTNRRYVHLKNTVLVFDGSGNMKREPFSPNFYSRNQSPIPFDENAKCPRFLNELIKPALKEGDISLMQKYYGQCLLGHNITQRILIQDGTAGGGKTTSSAITQKIVGLENFTQLRTKHLDERFELYRFLGKTLLVGVDVPGNFLSERGAYVLKGLVGGDLLTTEKKGGNDGFLLHGNFNIIITSNSRLQVRFDGDLAAWKRRLLIVRYELPPPKIKIPDFANILIREEGSGILNWALEGLRMLFDDIRQYGDIYLGDSQNQIIDTLMAESDSLKHFLKDCVMLDAELDLSNNEVVENYAEYCASHGWNPKPITIIHREVESLMLELFGVSKSHSIIRNGKSAKGFRGVNLKSLQFGTLGTPNFYTSRYGKKETENIEKNIEKYISTKESETSVPSVPKSRNPSGGDTEEIPEIEFLEVK